MGQKHLIRKGNMQISIEDAHLSAIARFANGDARTALNTLEMAVFNGRMNEEAVLCVDEEVLSQCMNRLPCYTIRMGKSIII